MSQRDTDGGNEEGGPDTGRPIALDATAESANPNLPAFLAPPAGALAYHGFPILDGLEVDGWRLGLITDSIGTDDNFGDAYLIAPDGRRAGVVWQVAQPSSFIELIGPERTRFGVFEVAVANGPTSLAGARRFISEVLPPIREAWDRSKP